MRTTLVTIVVITSRHETVKVKVNQGFPGTFKVKQGFPGMCVRYGITVT
jgi:hypothetical protein